MNTEHVESDKVVVDTKFHLDTREVVAKLSFLVGKTIAFRDGYSDATTATQVVAVKAENTPGTMGFPQVSIYTQIGIETIRESKRFNDLMVLESDGSLVSLGNYTDKMGICF